LAVRGKAAVSPPPNRSPIIVQKARHMESSAVDPVVKMHGIVKTYPGVRALDDVHLDVGAGEVQGLVGKNGAGKSTLINILNGLTQPDSGSIRIRGVEYSGLTAARARSAGIAHVAQHVKYVPGLSIAENISLGDLPERRGWVDWRTLFETADEKLRKFGLDLDVRRPMEATSVAERQMIEIARALFADASVIILDEPTAPLPKREVERLFSFVSKQKELGASFIYISHFLEEIFEIADRATVLRNGRVVGMSDVSDLTQKDLVHLISGTSVQRFSRQTGELGDVVLKTRNLSRDNAYSDVSLEVRAGEVVGLTGLEGSGPGALARGLFGLEELGDGEVSISGKPYVSGSPVKAIAQGMANLPRDRHGLGIVAIRTVKDNISLSILGRLENRFGILDGKKEKSLVREYIDSLSIVTPSMDVEIANLSGGNQQKCVVARFAATSPKVLILDEPTQGVDIAAKAEILRIVDDLSKRGVAVCIVSDEINEMIDICDRIVIFHRGRITREFIKSEEEITPKQLIAAIEGVDMEAQNEPL